MSNVIDQRVVEMKFDNKNFESNVKTSLSTLDKLKQSLKFSDSAKGFDNLNSSVSKINMSGLSNAIETVKTKFSALQVIGITALTRITDSAITAGKNIVSALTIDPILSGFQEYETQINAIQTILANTSHNGTTLDEVNAALDELNKYADMTIYNFTEMTKNIGTFTAAGLDLDTSVKGIQGIANLAAVSGSTSQQASTAMYQLSQAMAAGTVTLQDWNSVVNASMGGKVFQDAIMQTAKDISDGDAAVATAIEQYENGANFRSILNAKDNEAWLSSDILVAALSKFTKTGAVEYLSDLYDISSESVLELQKLGDTTGYNTDVFKEMALSLANGDEAIAKNITDVLTMADTATRAATEVKTFSQLWDTLKETAQSGWTESWEIIIGDFGEAKELLTEISNIFGGILDASSSSRNSLLLGGLGSGWKQLLSQGVSDSAGFEDTITSVAKNYGVNVEAMMEDGSTFQETMKTGWLTSDILQESITQFGEKLRGLSADQREEMGYTLEQIQTFTEFENKVKDGTISLDEFQKILARPSGRENLIEALRNSLTAVISVVNPVKEAFREIFPATTTEQLYNLTVRIKEFTAGLKLSETASDNLKRTFAGLFAVLDIVKQVFVAIFNAIKPLFSGLRDLSGGFLGVTATIGDWLVGLDNSIKKTDIFNKTFSVIANVVKTVASAFKEFIGVIKENIVSPGLEAFQGLLDRVKERMSGISSVADIMRKGVVTAIDAMSSALANSDFIKIMSSIWNIIKIVGSAIVKLFGALASGLASAFGGANFSGVLDVLNSLIAGGIGVGIINFLKSTTETIKGLGDIKDSVIDVFDGIRGCFEAYQTQLKAETLLKIAGAIAILAVSILIVSTIDSDKLMGAIGAITSLFGGLVGSMAILDKMNGGLSGALKASSTMVSLSLSVLILAGALKTLASLEWEGIAKGLTGVAGLAAIIVASAMILGSSGSAAIKGAGQMILFAAAIKILASACADLSELSWEEMAKGLVGIGALMLEIAAFTNLSGNAKHILSTGVALIAIAAAMKIFASATADFAEMSWEEMAKGLVGMAGALAAVTIALNLMPKNVAGIGIGLIAVSAALLILANALGTMGDMSWEEIAKGLVTLGGSMAILAIGLNTMNGTLAGSAALLVASAALLVLTPVLKILGGMNWEEIAKGLIAIAGAFTIIGVAGAVLGPLVPAILGLSGALALIGVAAVGIGVGLIAAGAGLSAIAVGVTALATALAGGATAIVAAIAVIVTGIVALIPAIIEQIGKGIVAFVEAIANGYSSIANAVKTIILKTIEVFVECIPALADGVLKLIVGVLEAAVKYTPQIVDLIFDFLIKLIDGIASRIPDLIKSAVNLLMQFFSGVVDALKGIDVETMAKGIAGVGIMTAIMAALAAVASLTPAAMVGVLGLGAVVAELSLVLAAVGALAQIPGLEWLINEGGDLLLSIGKAIGKFIGGIVGGVAEGITSALPQIGSDLTAFMENASGFLDGARSINSEVMEGVKALAEVILILTAANIIDGLTSWFTGGSALSKFGAQLPELGTNLNQFATNLGTFTDAQVTTITCAANAVKAIADAADDIPNEGGWVGKILGENSIAAFGSGLPGLGTNIKDFATNLGTFTEAQVTTVACAANAIKAMAEAADEIPNEGGWVAKLVGDNSLATFGSKLPVLGTNIKKFASNLGTFGNDQIDTVKCASEAVKAMAEAANGIDGQADWAKKIFGDNSIGGFSEQFSALGTNLNKFVTNLGTFGQEQISTVSSAVKAINAFTDLADSNLKGAKKNLEGFGDKIVDLAKDIASFVKGMPASDSLSTAIGNVKKILKMIDDISGADANIATNFTKSLKSIGKEGVNAFVSAFTSSSAKTDVKDAGVKLIGQLTKGVESKKSDVKKSFKEVAESGIKQIKDLQSDFKDAGKYLVEGFANGITDSTWKAEAEAKAMARAAARAAERELDENSPSKVFYRIGDYAGQGFVNALGDYGTKAYSVSSGMADSARKGLQDSIGRIKDTIDGNVSTQPVIRPILDLSDVQSGASAINGLLSSRSSVGVLANVGSISSMMNRRVQNGGNGELISAINQLRKDLGNASGGTTIIEGVTYDDGSNISEAVQALVRAARVERRR